jgi:RNA polymerase sigma-70 factor (ECF subfamily)
VTDTPEQLLSRIKVGDEEAFTLIYRRYVARIRNFAGHMGIPSSSTEDVAQNVFMALIKNASSFDVQRGSALSFIYGIARNQILRWMRENKRVDTSLIDSEVIASEVNPFHDYSKSEEVLKLRNAIQLLPEHYREAVVLCELHELSYEQAAEILNCAVGTVRSRLHRGRSILAKSLCQTPGKGNGVSNYELPTLETNSY